MPKNTQDQAPQRANWNVRHAREFYSIHVWSEGYFDVNEAGHIVATPNENVTMDLADVSKEIRQQGLSYPVLVRFPQILQARVVEIDAAFQRAAASQCCQLTHIPCYPIKVNQQATVIETILDSDCERIGLEVGSKSELLVALGLISSQQQMLICNGYKDRAYIRIALSAQRMGIDVFIVIENPSELALIKHESEQLGVTPKLGLRLKLNSIASGKWQNSGGKDAKFGLNAQDILYCLDQLIRWGCRAWMTLIHFHMGSQITKLNEFSVGLQEALTVFGEIVARGFELEYLDVGGGLAIDYASRHDSSYFSRAYTVQEYADSIVQTIQQYCVNNNVDMPVLLTENGRAITAHHAMLISNTIAAREGSAMPQIASVPSEGDDEIYKLGEQLTTLPAAKTSASIQRLAEFERLLQERFLRGTVGLQQRAWADAILRQHESMHEKYYCNFSMFQSLPDVWGLGQVFPITPLTQLQEQPTTAVQLYDLTCDSDGHIEQYAYNNNISDCLTLHDFSDGDEYLLGFFLLGAYQEVLGDMHNLFGDTHAVNVTQDRDGHLQLGEIEIGDCVSELLHSIHLPGEKIMQRCRERLEMAPAAMNATTQEILEEINNALYGYTYLDSIDRPAHRIKGR